MYLPCRSFYFDDTSQLYMHIVHCTYFYAQGRTQVFLNVGGGSSRNLHILVLDKSIQYYICTHTYSAQKGAKKNSLTSGLYHAAGFLGPHTLQKRLELMMQRCKSRMYFNGRNPENVVFYRFHGDPGPSGPPWVSPCVCVLKTQILMHGDCECPLALYSGKRLTQATTKIIQTFMIPLAQRLSFQ